MQDLCSFFTCQTLTPCRPEISRPRVGNVLATSFLANIVHRGIVFVSIANKYTATATFSVCWHRTLRCTMVASTICSRCALRMFAAVSRKRCRVAVSVFRRSVAMRGKEGPRTGVCQSGRWLPKLQPNRFEHRESNRLALQMRQAIRRRCFNDALLLPFTLCNEETLLQRCSCILETRASI